VNLPIFFSVRRHPEAYFLHQTGNTVMVDMLLTFEKAEDIDTYIDMGFREGITQTLDQLEEIL
jgi:hypothetical protein